MVASSCGASDGVAGTANTGGGGGGAGFDGVGFTSIGGNGGSGVVIIRYDNGLTISNPGGGLTYSTSADGAFTVATFTAGTGNVQWN
jgi:hypothetical protein